MFKRKNYFALGAVVLVTLAIFSLPPRATSRLKLAVGSLFLPLFGLANTAQQLPATAADAILSRRELLKKVGSLEQENQQLKIQQLQSAATARENGQLRSAIGWQQQKPWKMKLANVVMRDPANWWRTAQIDLGSRNGLTVNLPILSPEGFLIGRVSSVDQFKSQIILIGDSNCRVSARVENPTHDIGVLGAGGPLDDSLVGLSYLSSGANLKSGEGVVTSGEGGIFPPGIPIGQIVDAQQVEFGLYTEARVKLNANLGALEEVWVLFP
ncbi:MAG TPA: rod shape-determining protein MreC [Dongiaceae bacterium]|jgi:rod shape-determining protein MreC|nr:rod shape-determining protein MreC [Dongiaceae bacterium]